MYQAALLQIQRLERALKLDLYRAQRGCGRWMAEERSQAWLMMRLEAMREKMARAILASGRQAYAAGWRTGTLALERRRARRFREGEPEAPEIPATWMRWYEDTVDQALRRYTDRIRRGIADLAKQAVVEGWDHHQLGGEIQKLADGMLGWRAEMIARTETMRLWNLGHYGRFEADEEVIGYRYSVVMDIRTSHYCKPLHGLTVRREELRYIPPLHPHCRTVLDPVLTIDEVSDDTWGDPEEAAGVKGFGAVPRLPAKPARSAPEPPAEPAKPVQAATEPSQAAKPVSAALDVRLRSSDLRTPAEEAIGAIDAVHGDGELPQIPLRRSTSLRFKGAITHDPRTGMPVKIELSTTSDTPALTTAHEIGHFLDLSGLSPAGAWTSETLAPEMEAWRRAVDNSNAIQTLRKRLRGDNIEAGQYAPPVGRGYVAYTLKPREIWARTYAQYIATKSGNRSLLADLDKMRQSSLQQWYPSQWSDEDFGPIASAIEGILKAKGWIR